ncbi:MAG: DUF1015 domain-containing protein [Treponema sp.]
MKNFADFGMKIPEILLPSKKNLSSWSVIACDQYTQDADYWKKVEDAVGKNPSTLNLILPEIYLASSDRTERIEKIRSTMKSYMESGVFDSPAKEFIYIERKTCYGRIRHGLVCAIDLETYEWKPMSKALIRATEATIVERIPPRMEIRRGAPLESPHIMLLVNDPEHIVVEKTGELVKKESPVYDGNLMLSSGHITGWAVKSEKALDSLHASLEKIKKANTSSDGSTFMFAVGDGNHSLATAKAVWDEYKKDQLAKGATEESLEGSNVRYALVEIVNIYDSGLTFEPIHRVLFGTEADMVIAFVQANLGGTVSICDSRESLENKVKNSKSLFGFVFLADDGKVQYECLETEIKELAVSRLQPVLDTFISSQNEGASYGDAEKKITIDYIHGSDEVFRLGSQGDTVTILLPPVAKDSFFTTINSNGPLPRKSFSMGEASEKRFYLECRKLFD